MKSVSAEAEAGKSGEDASSVGAVRVDEPADLPPYF
jgi:hypothetical protein